MKALILAGGFGTRLRPLSCTRPKILFPILNKPLIEWIMEKLSESNINEVIFAVNRQTALHLKQAKLKFPKNEIKITYSYDPPKKPLGTGGPIKRAEKILGKEDFLIVNGDIFTDINYSEIIQMHKEKGAVATIALYRAEDPSRYGVAELSEDGKIRRFIEKPPPGSAPSNIVNAGIYVLSPEIFSYIPKGRKVSLEREIFPILVREEKLYGYLFKGLWTDIGKTEDYFMLHRILLETFHGKVECLVKGEGRVAQPSLCGEGSVIGKGSTIGPYTVLGRKVKVGRDVQIKNSITFDGVSIADSSIINGAIIGENVAIGKGVQINEDCVIGDHASIGNGVTLAKGVIICPAKEVLESVTASKCVF
ncbi:MAG: NDP-sugar synthase [Candidatus Bathyarchaeota archaeon]|nr:NDP-sugar synthase [Candidatus Bathyarchaeota archaeon]